MYTDSPAHPPFIQPGGIQSSEHRTVTKDRQAAFGYDPEQFPRQARDFSAVLRQCGGHEFHEISKREELFLNN